MFLHAGFVFCAALWRSGNPMPLQQHINSSPRSDLLEHFPNGSCGLAILLICWSPRKVPCSLPMEMAHALPLDSPQRWLHRHDLEQKASIGDAKCGNKSRTKPQHFSFDISNNSVFSSPTSAWSWVPSLLQQVHLVLFWFFCRKVRQPRHSKSHQSEYAGRTTRLGLEKLLRWVTIKPKALLILLSQMSLSKWWESLVLVFWEQGMKSSNVLGKGEGNQKKLNCPAKNNVCFHFWARDELFAVGQGEGGCEFPILYLLIPV